MVDRRKFINSTQSSFIIHWDYPAKATKVGRIATDNQINLNDNSSSKNYT